MESWAVSQGPCLRIGASTACSLFRCTSKRDSCSKDCLCLVLSAKNSKPRLKVPHICCQRSAGCASNQLLAQDRLDRFRIHSALCCKSRAFTCRRSLHAPGLCINSAARTRSTTAAKGHSTTARCLERQKAVLAADHGCASHLPRALHS